MTIPATLLHTLADHRRAGRRAGLVVRHAERHPIVDLRTHHTLLLTERGHAMADDGGRALAALLTGASSPAPALRLRAVHSPVERCAETARGLVQGARAGGAEAVVVGEDVVLGDPFLRDRRRALALAHELGHGFLRAWFDGRVDDDVLQHHREAAHHQLAAWARHVGRPDGADRVHDDDVVVMVSHDWNIALVREVVLGVRHEDTWPQFLDGVVVALDGDDVVVSYDGRTGRVPRATRARANG
jgi:hypothetical protein